ncbi:hypothetical protein TcCL_Unassigned02514 [Trypanosoma cruzi]|nr:hypothetical protein TcCL_Unassigned02514 [Trypanosoma cruzi]
MILAAVAPNHNNSRTQTHGTRSRNIAPEHTATATTSRSHGGCVVRHASAHTKRSTHTHTHQPARCKRAQPPFAVPTRCSPSFTAVPPHTHQLTPGDFSAGAHHPMLPDSPRRQIHSGRDTPARAAAEQESSRTLPRHPQHHTTHWPAHRHHHARDKSTRQIAGSRPPSSRGTARWQHVRAVTLATNHHSQLRLQCSV